MELLTFFLDGHLEFLLTHKLIFRIRSSNTISMQTHWTTKRLYYGKIHVDFYAAVVLNTVRNPLPDSTDFKLPDVTVIYKAVVMVWVITGQAALLIGRLSQLQTRGVDHKPLGPD